MRPRNVCAAEIQELLETMQGLIQHGEALARSTGMVNPSLFGAMRSAVTLAAGELDQKGLLVPHGAGYQPVAQEGEPSQPPKAP